MPIKACRWEKKSGKKEKRKHHARPSLKKKGKNFKRKSTAKDPRK